MTPQPTVPFVPDNAPFTPAQRAWLNGFLAGMFCRTEAPGAAAPLPAKPRPKLSIFFGSQSGNAESLAKQFGREAQKQGYEAAVAELEQTCPKRLPRKSAL